MSYSPSRLLLWLLFVIKFYTAQMPCGLHLIFLPTKTLMESKPDFKENAFILHISETTNLGYCGSFFYRSFSSSGKTLICGGQNQIELAVCILPG